VSRTERGCGLAGAEGGTDKFAAATGKAVSGAYAAAAAAAEAKAAAAGPLDVLEGLLVGLANRAEQMLIALANGAAALVVALWGAKSRRKRNMHTCRQRRWCWCHARSSGRWHSRACARSA